VTNKTFYGIDGASGFAKEIMPLICNKIKDGDYLCFIDDSPNAETLNGVDILTSIDLDKRRVFFDTTCTVKNKVVIDGMAELYGP